MKPVVIRLYAVLVVLTLVALVAWAGADWYQLRQKAEAQGRTTLRQAAGLISSQTIRDRGLDSRELSRIFAQVPGPGTRWKVLLVTSDERGTEFYRGPRPAVPADQAVPRWEPRQFSEVRITLPAFRAEGSPLTLEGIYEFYGRTEIFSLLKACGLTLCLLLVLTTLMTVLSIRRPPSFQSEAEAADQGLAPGEPVAEETGEAPFDFPDAPELDLSVPAADDEYWFDDELTIEDLPPLETPVPPEPTRTTAVLGREEDLLGRLDQVLAESQARGTDVSLILLSTAGLPPEPEIWAEVLRKAFPETELFAWENGTAVILTDHGLDTALRAARDLVAASEPPLGTVHAGLSARSDRALTAKVLVAEARSALRRSMTGTVRVLGLRADPDRWRENQASA